MGLRKTARSATSMVVGKYYGPTAGAITGALLKKVTAKSRNAAVAPAQLLQGTRLKSYLDRRYAKKCGVEVKQLQYIPGPGLIGTTLATQFNPLEGTIPQGTTDSTRIGSRIEIKRIQMKFKFSALAASTGPCQIRFIFLKVGDMAGTNPGSGSVLISPGNIRSMYLQENDQTRAFTIIKDKTFKLSAVSSGDQTITKEWSWTYKPKGCHSVEWLTSDTTGSLANMTKGNFLGYIMYESVPVAGQQPTLYQYTNVEWVDL